MIRYHWRGAIENRELNALHAEGFGHSVLNSDWVSRLERHSLGWVCARQAGDLVGFVNLVWDGGAHAFLIDTVVAAGVRHQGVGSQLVATAATEAQSNGCQWVHVDFEEHLSGFYFDACGFRPTMAGLLQLQDSGPGTDSPQLSDSRVRD